MYHNTERTPIVLAELARLFLPLNEEQLAALEADLLQNGYYSPVIINEELAIADGYNCQGLRKGYGIPYNMAVFALDDLLEAKQWALDAQRDRRNLDEWELSEIALKLKSDIEVGAKANTSASGGDQKSEHTRLGSAALPSPISTVDARKELADMVGLGECIVGKVMQIDEHTSAAAKEALSRKKLFIRQGYQITEQTENLSEEQREQAALGAAEPTKAKKGIQEKNTETDRKGKTARVFCKAYEKVALLDLTEENVRIQAKCTRTTRNEMGDAVKGPYKLAEVPRTIADFMERPLPERGTL